MGDDYISTFVDVFRHEREHYVAVEHEVETLCKTFLYEKGVKFCWESRVKQPDSLQTKLLGRNHRYPDQHANCADIKDLVAGRIILPRWSNFKVVEEMIKEHFELQATTQHPKAPWGNATTLRQRFRGYDGFHFYFKRKIPVAGAFNPTIEIQVMSPFMWTFQDLHHDVEYKELCGKPSQEESRALEYLKGIANLGELAIQNFETAFSARHQPSSKSMDDVLESEVPKKTPIVQDLESQEDMKSLKALVIEQARGMDSLLQMLRQQSDGSNEIISWISSTNVDVEHSRIRDKLGKHYHHSGQWFKRHYYSSWIASTDKPTMWLAGSVGTGKSSLMSNVIEWHFERIQATGERLAYFYCTRAKEKEGTPPLEVLRSLVAQLSQSNGVIVPEITSRYTADKTQPLDINECCEILAKLIQRYPQTTFIIDALDECRNADALLQNLEDVYNPDAKVKFLFSGRLQVDLPESFPRWEKVEIDFQRHSTAEDMETYIRTQVEKRRQWRLGKRLLDGRYPELEQRLIQVLSDTANGMFRWTELQLEVFLGPNSRMRIKKDVVTKLDRLEDEKLRESPDAARLRKVYDEVYDDNTAQNTASRKVANSLMRWIMAAPQPLHLRMLADIAMIAMEDDTMDPSLNHISADEVLHILCNFIITDDDHVVQFAHISVREYFTGRVEDGVQEFSHDKQHGEIATISLAFLSHPRIGISQWDLKRFQKFWPSISLSDVVATIETPMGLAMDFNVDKLERAKVEVQIHWGFPIYTCIFWAKHWGSVTSESQRSGRLGDLYRKFIKEDCGRSLLLNWVTIFPAVLELGKLDIISGVNLWPKTDWLKKDTWVLKNVVSEPPNVIFAACMWNFFDVVTASSYDIASANHCNNMGFPAMNLAVRHRSYDILQALIRKGANAAMRDVNGDTALHEAAYEVRHIHDEYIAKLLIDMLEPAIAAIQNERNRTALHVAAYNGQEGMVRLLLEKMQPANIILTDKLGETALHNAASQGHETVVRLILEKMEPAGIARENIEGLTALDEAIYKGHENVAQILRSL